RDTLLAPAAPDRRVRTLACEERPRAGGVPRTTRVVADPPAARGEDRVASRLERLPRHEPHELVERRVCHRRDDATRSGSTGLREQRRPPRSYELVSICARCRRPE